MAISAASTLTPAQGCQVSEHRPKLPSTQTHRPSTPPLPSPWPCLWYLLTLFLGSPCHRAELMGMCCLPVFSLAGEEHGKTRRVSSALPPRVKLPPKSAEPTRNPLLAPAVRGSNDVRKDGARPLQLRFMGRTLNLSGKVSPWVGTCRGISALMSITHSLNWPFFTVNMHR